jgi:hypothetical protein
MNLGKWHSSTPLLQIFRRKTVGVLNRMTMEVGGSGITATAVGLLEKSAIDGKIIW